MSEHQEHRKEENTVHACGPALLEPRCGRQAGGSDPFTTHWAKRRNRGGLGWSLGLDGPAQVGSCQGHCGRWTPAGPLRAVACMPSPGCTATPSSEPVLGRPRSEILPGVLPAPRVRPWGSSWWLSGLAGAATGRCAQEQGRLGAERSSVGLGAFPAAARRRWGHGGGSHCAVTGLSSSGVCSPLLQGATWDPHRSPGCPLLCSPISSEPLGAEFP